LWVRPDLVSLRDTGCEFGVEREGRGACRSRAINAHRSAGLSGKGEEVPGLVEALEAVLTAVTEMGLSAEQKIAHG